MNDELRGKGARQVQFAAQLPSGEVGCFTLALPTNDKAGPALDLRMHREHVGCTVAAAAPAPDVRLSGPVGATAWALASTDVPTRAGTRSAQASPGSPPVDAAARLLETANPTDPRCQYWTSYCLYQMGGDLWKGWRDRLADIEKQQHSVGTLAGS